MKRFVVTGEVGLATVIEARDYDSARRKARRFNYYQGVGYRSYLNPDGLDVFEFVSPGKQAQYDRRWAATMRQLQRTPRKARRK